MTRDYDYYYYIFALFVFNSISIHDLLVISQVMCQSNPITAHTSIKINDASAVFCRLTRWSLKRTEFVS